jgi:hypothetical protein
MRNFPPLINWFRFINEGGLTDIQWKTVINWYYEYNDCSFFTLLWKNSADKDDFIKEFVKLIARIRTWWDKWEWTLLESYYLDLVNFIDNNVSSLSQEIRKEFVDNIFANWMKSWTTQNIDKDMCRWYIWEIIYYILREQLLQDEKIQINPRKPKNYSKEPGLDFTEIRRNDDGYYLIIWEVKSTHDTIRDYPDRIINQLNNRHRTTFAEHINYYKELISDGLIAQDELKIFINQIYNFSNINNIGFRSDKKRFSWIINYWKNTKHGTTPFNKFKNDTSNTLYNANSCRKVKLIGIKDFDNIVERIYACIFTDYLS